MSLSKVSLLIAMKVKKDVVVECPPLHGRQSLTSLTTSIIYKNGVACCAIESHMAMQYVPRSLSDKAKRIHSPFTPNNYLHPPSFAPNQGLPRLLDIHSILNGEYLFYMANADYVARRSC